MEVSSSIISSHVLLQHFSSITPVLSSHRATVFTLLAASGLAPIFHVISSGSPCDLIRIPWETLMVTCSSYAIGTVTYLFRFPERYWPAQFDIIVSLIHVYCGKKMVQD